MAWNFKRENTNSYTTKISEGNHRIRVKSAEKAVSKSGNDMLVLQFDVSGYTETIYHYITFMPDKPEITNRMLTQFFDSFKDIADGELDTAKWVGKVGACSVKHEEYNGNVNAKVDRFIPAEKQDSLPPWKDADGNVKPAPVADADGFMSIPDNVGEELPF
jgi:hypothetical protein